MEINGNFNPISAKRARDVMGVTTELAGKLDKAGGDVTGIVNYYAPPTMIHADTTGIATSSGGRGAAEVRGRGAGSAAFMQFHRPGEFASYLGLDTDNQFKVGGWSMGAAAYKLWHEGNTPDLFKPREVNVKDYGASPSADFSTNTNAFQAAYNACPANGRIIVPAGVYDYGKPTGTKNVLWLAHGATYVNGGAMSLPGVVESMYGNRILYQKTSTPTDPLSILDLQNNGCPGGNTDFVSSTFSAVYNVHPEQKNGCWTTTFVMESNSSNGNYPVQNSGLAVVSKQNVFNGTSLFGVNIEASEFHNQSNPTTNLLGAEIAVLAMGQDANNVRTGLSLPFQKRFPQNPGGVEFATGLHMNQGPLTRVKRGFLIEGDYDYVFKVERANTTQGIFHVASDAGQKALVMNANQRAIWLDANGAELATLGVNQNGVAQFSGNALNDGSPTPGNVAKWKIVIENGQVFKTPLYAL